MNINEIRQAYLDYFSSKNHKIVSSAPMVVKNDPTLMFTNAGMNQFKDYFLGYNEAKDKRVANSQKCLRVSGKHNDLEEVGVDTYHHTMFEMLGNWSFGDYFKKESIAWAWDLLTNVYKLDKDRLYVTVFEGDEEDDVPVDQESIDFWKAFIDEDRILKCDKGDNFWEMGDTGPCGPCSEIHVDIRSDEERKKIDGKTLVNKDHPQVVEIWNLVFMQFNRKANGSLEPLPATHVDTGMGLERLAMVIQGVQSNYDTDLFQHLIQHLVKISRIEYGVNENTDIALRVIADHIRAISFSISDGQLPSNTGAGYVIRRILRRAVRYGYQTLNLKEPFLYSLVDKLDEIMGGAFPELSRQKELIKKVVIEEEQSFFRTLENGLKRIQTLIDATKLANGVALNGAAVFELHDTFGFPPDLTSLIARENGLSIDEAGFSIELEKAKERSRAATQIESDDWVILREDDIEEFVGYDYLESDIFISKYRKVKQKNKEFYQLVFNITPFYAEGGGQVGDQGVIKSEHESIEIFDTKRENNLIVHLSTKLPKDLIAKFRAFVAADKRKLSQANHSATHLLHHELRNVLGTHVEQKGSLVNDKNLRFDFSHFSRVTEAELEEIERRVNTAIRNGIQLTEKRAVPMEIAQEMGAMALFGEKYGDLVRVIQFGNSVELCGGTHVQSTTDIRFFKIISEGSVASGIRRIEAITADGAEELFKDRLRQFESVATLMKNPKDVVKSVEDLVARNNALQKELETLQRGQLKQMKESIMSRIVAKNGLHIYTEILELEAGQVKDLCFQLKAEITNLVCVIGSKHDDKATLTVALSDNLVTEKSWNAGTLIREAAKLIQGGGGGQPNFATAGGQNPGGLKEAIEKTIELLGI